MEIANEKGGNFYKALEAAKASLIGTAEAVAEVAGDGGLGELGGELEKAAKKTKGLSENFIGLDLETSALLYSFSLFENGTQTVAQGMDNAAGAVLALGGGYRELYAGANVAAKGIDKVGDAVIDGVKSAGILQTSFSDLLGKGFAGELESFADLWDEVWQDLAKSMTGILGDAFQTAMAGGYRDDNGDWVSQTAGQAFGGAIENNKAGSIIGGAGMMYSGAQQGGGGGILQGLMGGAMAGAGLGAMTATPFGMLAGAIVGGIVGGLGGLLGGGEDKPESWVFQNDGGGYGLETRGGQGMGSEARDVWSKNMNAAQKVMEGQWRDMLANFFDPSLFDLVGSIEGIGTGGWVEMSADQLAKWLTDVAMPEMFQSAFKRAIDTGLGNLGVSDAAMDALWSEIGELPGQERMKALNDYIRAVVGLTQLSKDMAWDSIQADAGASQWDKFGQGLDEVFKQIDMAMVGWDDMSLVDRAREAQTIQDLITGARQAEIQMLQQIQQLSESINTSVDQQLEGLLLGGMKPGNQQAYLEDKIQGLMADLEGATDFDQVAQLMAQIQQVIGQLASGYEGDLYGISPGGDSYADMLAEWLEQARAVSTTLLAGWEDEIAARNADLAERTNAALNGLTDFTLALGGLTDPMDDFTNRLNDGRDAVTDLASAAIYAADALRSINTGMTSRDNSQTPNY